MDIVLNEELKKEMKDAQIAWTFGRSEDSKVPALFISKDSTDLAFCKNGISYFLSSKYGYTARACILDIKKIKDRAIILKLHMICNNDIISHSWQISKKEFIQAKRAVLELLKNCSDEYKRICLDVIDKLDYEEGYNNARFSIYPNLQARDKILIIRFNYKNIYYEWILETNTLIRGDINDPFSHLHKKEIKGLEKKLVLRTMHISSVLDKKIGEFYNK